MRTIDEDNATVEKIAQVVQQFAQEHQEKKTDHKKLSQRRIKFTAQYFRLLNIVHEMILSNAYRTKR
jgi:hypothetical protein